MEIDEWHPPEQPTVPTEPTTADSIETASTPASHRPRNGREEVAVPLGVAMDSPALIAAGVGPAGEGRRTGVSGTKVGSGAWSMLSMTASTDPAPEKVLRFEGMGCPAPHTR